MRVVALDTLAVLLQDRADVFAVVASQGHYDEEALGAILKARPAYVGLVASRKRGATVRGVLQESGASGTETIRIPAGLDLGARTAPEVALSILAEIAQMHPSGTPAEAAPLPRTLATGAAGECDRSGLRHGGGPGRGAAHGDGRWRRLRLLLCELPHPLRERSAGVLSARDMTDATAIRDRFRERGFIVDDAFATALQIMLALEKPLLVEGPSGVGKTESAKVLADVLGTRLIRLQCYEGLDAMSALYEWNYPRQMLHARLSEAAVRRWPSAKRRFSASRSCSSGRCSRRSHRIDCRCCWSTKSIERTRRSRHSCSKCWPSGR